MLKEEVNNAYWGFTSLCTSEWAAVTVHWDSLISTSQ